MKKILNNKLIAVSVSIVVALLILGISFYKGDQYALDHLTAIKTSPNQLANAMQQDDFYSTYRENTLIFSGVVTFVTRTGNNTFIGIKTSVSYSLSCDINGTTNSLRPGITTRLLANAYIAERKPTGVLLRGCIQL